MSGRIDLSRFQTVFGSRARYWSGQLPGPGFWNALRRYGCAALLVAATLLAIWCAWFLIRASDLGPELSDSAFYIQMHRAHDEILATLSGFGVLMQALAGNASIQTMRLAMMLALFATPVLFLWAVGGHNTLDPMPNRQARLLWAGAAIVAGCSSFIYYKWLLLDPSYNGLLLPALYLCALGLWGIWGEITAPRGPDWLRLNVNAVLTGAALFCMALFKISSAIVLIGIALPVLSLAILATPGVHPGRATRHLVITGILTLPGAAAVLALIWLRVLPPDELWSRFLAGYEVTQLMSAHNTSMAGYVSDLMRNLDLLSIALQANALWIAPMAGCILLALFRPRRDGSRILRSLAGTIACLAVLIGAALNHAEFTAMARFTWVFALAISAMALFSRPIPQRAAVFAVLFAWAPYGLSFGTASLIAAHAAIFSGTAVTAILLCAIAIRPARPALLISGMILGGATVISAFGLAAQKPYRMGATLAEATQRIEVRGEIFRVTPSVGDTYRALDAVRQMPAWANREGRPVLIDMTGRMPLLHWLGDFRVPGVAWTLSGYPGSQALLAWALAQVTHEDLGNMWIVIDTADVEGTRKGLSVGPLDDRLATAGLTFPRDYVRVGPAIPIAYMKQQAWVYAPRHLSGDPAPQ